MKHLFAAACIALLTSASVFAADVSCQDKAAEKKLAGAAKASFIKKCEKDAAGTGAASSCAAKAAEKKLAGAAKNSFMKKCEKDAQASK